MRKMLFVIYLLVCINSICSSQKNRVVVNAEIVDVAAILNSGDGTVKTYINEKVDYHSFGIVNGYSGQLIVSFIVNKEGCVTNVQLVQGIHRELNLKLIECIKGMPTWTPATHDGKPTEVKYTVSIQFNMAESIGVCVITAQNDTIYGNVKILTKQGGKGTKIWVNKGTASKRIFKSFDLKKIHDYNRVYVIKPNKPEKNSGGAILMTEIINNGQYQLLKTNSLFFLYEGEKFVSRLNRKNYKQIFTQYFDECPRFGREMKYNKRVTLFDAEAIYHRFCK